MHPNSTRWRRIHCYPSTFGKARRCQAWAPGKKGVGDGTEERERMVLRELPSNDRSVEQARAVPTLRQQRGGRGVQVETLGSGSEAGGRAVHQRLTSAIWR